MGQQGDPPADVVVQTSKASLPPFQRQASRPKVAPVMSLVATQTLPPMAASNSPTLTVLR